MVHESSRDADENAWKRATRFVADGPSRIVRYTETARNLPGMNQNGSDLIRLAQTLARLSAGLRIDAPVQPAFDELQVTIHGGLGNLHEGRSFFGCAAQKVSQFDELNFALIELVQFVQCA